jgi:hypothetical protein
MEPGFKPTKEEISDEDAQELKAMLDEEFQGNHSIQEAREGGQRLTQTDPPLADFFSIF